MTPGDSSVDELQRDVERAHRRITRLEAHMRRLGRLADQLALLSAGNAAFDASLEKLERMLDAGHVGGHFRQTVAGAVLVRDPVPHLRLSPFLPEAVYGALVDALPGDALLEDESAAHQELPVAPRSAPPAAIVTWTFLSDVIRDPLAGLVLAKFEPDIGASVVSRFPGLPPVAEWNVEVGLMGDRIVRRVGAGTLRVLGELERWTLVSGVLNVAGADGNSALVFVGTPDEQTRLLPALRPGATPHYTYEFMIGPTLDARRALAALLARP